MKCSVTGCKNLRRFKFPKKELRRKKWLQAIQRPDLEIKPSYGLCDAHFHPRDIIRDGLRTVLQFDAIPSLNLHPKTIVKKDKLTPKIDLTSNSSSVKFKVNLGYHKENNNKSIILSHEDKYFNIPLEDITILNEEFDKTLYKSNQMKSKKQNSQVPVSVNDHSYPKPNFLMSVVQRDHDYQKSEEMKTISSNFFERFHPYYIKINPGTDNELNNKQKNTKVIAKQCTSTQTFSCPRYDILQFKENPSGLCYFTGVGNYEKFMTIFNSLTTDTYSLPINAGLDSNISEENQLFLVLWKLKKNCPDFELATHFNLNDFLEVNRIFIKWIMFMKKQWSLSTIWPTKKLIDYFMPYTFKKKFSKMKVVINGTEFQTFKFLSNELSPLHTELASEIIGVCISLCNFKKNFTIT